SIERDGVQQAKEIKQILGELFNDSAQDVYLRKRARHLAGYLVLIKQLKPEWDIRLIDDVDEQENEFIVIAALQLGAQLMDIGKDSIVSWAEDRALGGNNEVRSEAFLVLGKSYFFEAVDSPSLETFVKAIGRASDYFAKSKSE